MRIIDSQVNSGKGPFGGDCNIDFYDSIAKTVGITDALVVPRPTHILNLEDYSETSCMWRIEDDEIIYETHVHGPELRIIENPSNPYSLKNDHTQDEIRDLNMNSSINYHLLPKFHPKLDTLAEVERVLSFPSSVGLKIQGLATQSIPTDVSNALVDLLNNLGKPLYVHTDYLNSNLKDRLEPNMSKIISKNTPTAWINWAEENDLESLYLAHLLRLDPVAAEMAQDSGIDILVGIGPDLLLQDEPERLAIESNNVLEDAFRMFDSEMLTFNTDFGWNIFRRGDWCRNWKRLSSRSSLSRLFERKLSGSDSQVFEKVLVDLQSFK